MKKLLALMLAIFMVCALAACGGEETSRTESETASQSVGTSSVAGTSEDATSQDATSETSSEATSSEAPSDESSTEPSEDTSSEAPSQDTSSEESTDAPSDDPMAEVPEFTNKFVSIGVVDTKVNATSTNSIRITGKDVEPTYGSIVLYTEEYGSRAAEDLADFAVAVFEYDHEYFGYVMTEFYEVGTAEDVTAADDGFVLAIHEYQETYIPRVRAIAEGVTVFPHGYHLYDDLDYSIDKAGKAPKIDGKFDEDEWGDYFIDHIDGENESWSYQQFDKGDYYATADYYVTYDDTYLYLCVVVLSPHHYCPITQANAKDMWQYECIQVKYSSQSPAGDYISEHYDRVVDKTADNEKVILHCGFAVSDAGENCYYGTTGSLVGCSRDDENQITVYEVAMPFAEMGITPEKGMELGLTFSVNSTNESDLGKNIWKNIFYRNGGGVIGRNDNTKFPVITLD